MTILRAQLSYQLGAALAHIIQLAEKHQVARLEAFGSAVTQQMHEDSDVDLLVVFKSLPIREHGAHYFGLKHDLEDLLGRRVDLIELDTVVNPYFLKAIEAQRTLLYVA